VIYLIYGITDCPACLRACADLMEGDKEYVFIETDFSPSYRAHLKKKYQWKSFPIVVKLLGHHDKVLVGGYNQLRAHLETGDMNGTDFLDSPKDCPTLKNK
jgi:glutaredoxin-related protein